MGLTAIVYLNQQVKAACPNAHGVSIGRWQDKSTWRVTGSVTKAEQDTARAIFDSFDKTAWEAAQPIEKTRAEKLAAIEASVTVAQLREAVKALL